MKYDFDEGSSTEDMFWWWIEERTAIYVKKTAGFPKPWTDDAIMQTYKFTNAFRQLDKGTVALAELMAGQPHKEWTIFWYRLFNRYEHALYTPKIKCYDDLERYVYHCLNTDKKLFTGAHMVCGEPYVEKHVSYRRIIKEAWNQRDDLIRDTMLETFKRLRQFKLIGNFIAYEMVCDMRFHCKEFPDRNEWANVGPGASRGLRRLGMPPSLQSMLELYHRAPSYPFLFELREVEHSLCEFDKYERVRLGQGKPRGRYNGRSEAVDSKEVSGRVQRQ